MPAENEAPAPTTTATRPTFSRFGFGAISRRLAEGKAEEESAVRVYNALMKKVDGGDVSEGTKKALEKARLRLASMRNPS